MRIKFRRGFLLATGEESVKSADGLQYAKERRADL